MEVVKLLEVLVVHFREVVKDVAFLLAAPAFSSILFSTESR